MPGPSWKYSPCQTTSRPNTIDAKGDLFQRDAAKTTEIKEAQSIAISIYISIWFLLSPVIKLFG